MYGPYGNDGFPVENGEVVQRYGYRGLQRGRFLADAELLYLRHQAFKPDLSPLKPQDVKRPHLIPSPGFLEAIPQHRSFWTIDTMLHYDIPTGMGASTATFWSWTAPFYEVRGYAPGRAEFRSPPSGYTLYAGTYGQAGSTAAPAPIRQKGQTRQRQTAAEGGRSS